MGYPSELQDTLLLSLHEVPVAPSKPSRGPESCWHSSKLSGRPAVVFDHCTAQLHPGRCHVTRHNPLQLLSMLCSKRLWRHHAATSCSGCMQPHQVDLYLGLAATGSKVSRKTINVLFVIKEFCFKIHPLLVITFMAI